MPKRKANEMSTKALNEFTDQQLNDLKETIDEILWKRKRFVKWVECDTKEAVKHKYAFKGHGYWVGVVGYFRVITKDGKLNEEQEEWLDDYITRCCCYYYGQPCAYLQHGEDGECECRLGAEYSDFGLNKIK